MKLMYSFGTSAAAAVALAVSAFAQAPAQSSGQTQTPSTSAAQQGDQITISGCIQREADYRRTQAAGRGGAAGSGVGVGNEFILVNASMARGGAGATATPPAGPTGTTGTAKVDAAYELTGSGEGQVAQFVGKPVEITGRFKAAETGTAGRPTGGPTAGAPPTGVDVTSQDLALRELEVTSVKAAATGTCPAQ